MTCTTVSATVTTFDYLIYIFEKKDHVVCVQYSKRRRKLVTNFRKEKERTPEVVNGTISGDGKQDRTSCLKSPSEEQIPYERVGERQRGRDTDREGGEGKSRGVREGVLVK